MTTLAVAYTRCSTEDQHLSPEAQRATIEAWAKANDAAIVAWFSDTGIGGGADIDQRPALLQAIAAVKQQRASVLVVAKRDRLARDVYVAMSIERAVVKAKARVVSAAGEGNGDTPADEFMRAVLDGAAQYERALIRARTKAALAAKRARGERAGGVPFGFKADEAGKLSEDVSEQAILSAVAEMHAAGVSIRKIGAGLEARGMRSRAGKPFAFTQVRRMLAMVAATAKEKAA